jgi:hypothetical protein
MRTTRRMRTMRKTGSPYMIAALLLAALAASCGTQEKAPPVAYDDLYPLAVGDYWLFDETDSTTGITVQNRYEVTEETTYDFQYDDVGAIPVYLIEATFPSGSSTDTEVVTGGWRVEYVSDDGTRSVRMRHDIYDDLGALTKTRDYVPGFLRLDRSKVTVGDEWAEEYTRHTDTQDGTAVTQDTASYLYEVMDPETVTVPAGTFDCTVVKRTLTSGASLEVKIYYFAPGVGKVKEITEGTKEEVLTEYSVIAPADAGV